MTFEAVKLQTTPGADNPCYAAEMIIKITM